MEMMRVLGNLVSFNGTGQSWKSILSFLFNLYRNT